MAKNSRTRQWHERTRRKCAPKLPLDPIPERGLNMASERNPIAADAGRRHFLVATSGTFGVSLLAGALPRLAFADDLPHLSITDDPTAKLLNYTEDASNAAPPHQAGQHCANCNFFQGVDTGYGPCRLYAGKSVNAKGWCSGYAAKRT